MTEHAPDRLMSSIDIPKTIAGVLAAVSAAVVGSFLGVAGTLVGAALASIVGSVGTEVYHRLVDRGHQKLKSTFVTASAAVGTPPVAAAEDESPSEPEPQGPSLPRQIRWGRAAMVAGALFVLAMGSLTAFELISGKSAADAVGGTSSSGTTVCSVLCGKRHNASPLPVPSSTTAVTGTAPATTTAPAGGSSTTAPAQTDNGSTEQPTDNETTQAPAQDNQQDAATNPDAATDTGGTE
jgi:hypothetical protein